MRSLILWLLGVNLAFAHIPGAKETDEAYKWADRQMSQDNGSCCGEGDVQVLDAEEWNVAPDGHYRVHIAGAWRDVPLRSSVRDAERDPNPLGQAVVWWNRNTYDNWVAHKLPLANFFPVIYCFAPGTLT